MLFGTVKSTVRRKKSLLVSGGILAGYFVLYLVNAAFGGYDPHYTSDGRSRYDSGLLMHDCIMWQPRFGYYYNEYRFSVIGVLFYPLLQLDRRFIHGTHSVLDGDFPKWVTSVQIRTSIRLTGGIGSAGRRRGTADSR
jgi:hypothetical protein